VYGLQQLLMKASLLPLLCCSANFGNYVHSDQQGVYLYFAQWLEDFLKLDWFPGLDDGGYGGVHEDVAVPETLKSFHWQSCAIFLHLGRYLRGYMWYYGQVGGCSDSLDQMEFVETTQQCWFHWSNPEGHYDLPLLLAHSVPAVSDVEPTLACCALPQVFVVLAEDQLVEVGKDLASLPGQPEAGQGG
jgi:hypothetical protein